MGRESKFVRADVLNRNERLIQQLCQDRSWLDVGSLLCVLPKQVIASIDLLREHLEGLKPESHSEPTLDSHTEERICQ